jgi:hypothetical protein
MDVAPGFQKEPFFGAGFVKPGGVPGRKQIPCGDDRKKSKSEWGVFG